jgi:hypothetical protein
MKSLIDIINEKLVLSTSKYISKVDKIINLMNKLNIENIDSYNNKLLSTIYQTIEDENGDDKDIMIDNILYNKENDTFTIFYIDKDDNEDDFTILSQDIYTILDDDILDDIIDKLEKYNKK